MLGVVLFGKRAGAAVDEVRLQIQNGFQRDIGFRYRRDGLILGVPLGVNIGVGIGCGDDFVPKAQSHQLVARIGVGRDDPLRHMGKGNLRAVLGGQGKGEAALRFCTVVRHSGFFRLGIATVCVVRLVLGCCAAGGQAQQEQQRQEHGCQSFHDKESPSIHMVFSKYMV